MVHLVPFGTTVGPASRSAERRRGAVSRHPVFANRFCQHIVEAVKPEQLIDRDAKLLGEIDRRGSGKPVSAILIFLYLLMADTDHVAEFGL